MVQKFVRSSPSLKSATLFSVAGALVYGAALILLDVAIANRYGTGLQSAVYQAAYMIPTAIIGMLSGGAILGSFVPVFIRHGAAERHHDAVAFLRSSLATVIIALGAVTLLLMLAAPLLAGLIASGFDAAGRDDVARTLRMMLVMLVPHGVAYVYSSALLSIGRVGLANLAPVLIPIAGLLTFPWWGLDKGAWLIALGYVIGSLFMAAALGLLLRSEGFSIRPSSPEWNAFFQSYVFSSFAYGALAAVLFANQAFAGSLSAGDIAAFGFGTKLVSLALALFTTIMNSVALPYLTNMIGQADLSEVWPRARTLIMTVFGLAVIPTLIWVCVADWIVFLVYAHGQFSASDAKLVVTVQRIFVMQVPFFLAGIFCWRMLNSIGSWKSLLIASLPTLAVDIAAASFLKQAYGAPGIAGAHLFSIALWAAILFVCLRARLRAPIVHGTGTR